MRDQVLTDAVRDSIGTGIYFVTYESVKQILANARGTSPTHPLAVVVAGGLCGLVSWACVGYLKLPVRPNMLTEADIPHRHRKEHLPTQLPRRRQGQAEPAQDPVPEPPHVSRYAAHRRSSPCTANPSRPRRVHVSIVRRQRYFLHCI